jgi:hypothetical protein
MPLTTAQKATLKTHIRATPDLAAIYENGDLQSLANALNAAASPVYVVWKSSASTMDMAKVINYNAVAGMTTANTDRVQLFVRLNPTSFDPARADIRQFFTDTFSGALNGQGQATRDALEAFYRRNATRTEKLFATGTGTTVAPAVLGFEGSVTINELIGL